MPSFTIAPHTLLALARTASGEASRPILNGVHFRPDGIAEATNGHVLLWCRDALTGHDLPPQGVILKIGKPVVALAKAAAKVKRGRTAVPMPVTYHDGVWSAALADGIHATPAESPMDGPYPHTAQVYPRGEPFPAAPLGLGGTVLRWLADVADLANGGAVKEAVVALTPWAGERANVVRFRRENWLGLAMPMGTGRMEATTAPDSIHAWLKNEPDTNDAEAVA